MVNIECERIDEKPIKESVDGEDYEPYNHRRNKHPTSNWDTLGHLITGSLGASMLALPTAFRHVGLGVGIAGTILISCLASYCMHQLLRIQHLVCRRHRTPHMEYADVMKSVTRTGPDCLKWLSKSSPYMVDFFVTAYHIGICCAAIEFIAGSVKHVVDYHWHLYWDIRVWMLIVGLVIFPLNQIRTLKYLSPLSVVGDFLIFGGFLIVFHFIFADGMPSFEGKQWVASHDMFKGFALFFGTVMFSVQTIGVIVAIEKNMKTPEDYRKTFGVYNMGMMVITLADLSIGFWGYAKWGESTKPTITWNLPPASVLADILQLMFALQCLLSYPLQSFVPYEILWNNYLKSRKKFQENPTMWSILLRAIFSWSTVLFAIAIPFLDLLISIVGAFCLPTVGITFPAIMEICYFHSEKKLSTLLLLKNIGLILFGIISCLLSTYLCALSVWDQHELEKQSLLNTTVATYLP